MDETTVLKLGECCLRGGSGNPLVTYESRSRSICTSTFVNRDRTCFIHVYVNVGSFLWDKVADQTEKKDYLETVLAQ